ncbi:MAG: phenylalanine--tRNA ligase subunit beta [Clostridia bacterium]|nr:phenylalanine--tRNA ligase subunit beta [Clostridia bacterium]
MYISLSWLKRYVDIDVPVTVLCDKMIRSGFEVEDIQDLSETMKNVVVGQVKAMEKHPDSDHLWVCQVDVGGEEPIQIITGAQNVYEGAYVPAALHNSDLPNGMHITKGKLRGLPSNGMLCSGEELNLKAGDFPNAEVNGIMIMDDTYPAGTDMREVLHLDDYYIDFKITANRPDCNCVLGVAREAAVALGKVFKEPVPSYYEVGGDIHDHIAIRVEDYDLCNRYMGRVVKNLRIKESPDWMKQCLRAAGMRPINNIVDITNYVMLETGHPMHAFDLRDVKGAQIIVRRARNGEPFTALDDKVHTLTDEMLVIADAEAPSCLAGIIGGLNSEIKEDTQDLFLECAKFRRDSVRRTARALGVRTESSARFERGVDVIGVEYAMERALQLIHDLDAGDIISGVIDCNEGLPAPRELKVPAQRINDLLGIEVPFDTIVSILNSLDIETVLEDGELTCRIPAHRDDVEGCADLAEEIMRIYGCEHIVSTPIRGDIIRGRKLPERLKTDRVKKVLVANRMREISTYSFISGKAIDTLRLPRDDARRQAVTLLNPLGEEYSTMRTQLLTSMLTVLSTNYNRKTQAVRLFEVSKRFVPKALPLTEQPLEIPSLVLGMYGADEDFFTLKGIVENLLSAFGAEVDYLASSEPYLHPGRQAAAICGESALATFGEVHPDVAADYDMPTRVYLAEVDLAALFAIQQPRVLYKALPRFPAVERDLALLCDASTPVASIEKIIRKAGGKTLESVELFDVYQGNQIEAGKKSVAFSLKFRVPDRTLSDEDIDPVLNKIFAKLKENDCILRT